MEKLCRTCNTVKPIESFSKKTRKNGRISTQSKCKTCDNEYTRSHYRNNKEMYLEKARRNEQLYFERNIQHVLSYLKEHPCKVCGEDDILVLEFHHTGEETKEYPVGVLVRGYSLDTLIKEIEKCDVLCANCHRRLEATKRDFWKVQYAQ